MAIDKDSIIKDIICQLKPNGYTDDSPLWETIEGGLRKFSSHELSSLSAIIMSKRMHVEND